MTSLADEARALGRGPGGQCGVRKLLATLGQPEQAEVREAIANRDLSAAKVSKAIRNRGWYPVSDQSITRHRQGVCACE